MIEPTWEQPPARPALEKDEVHLWRVSLACPPAEVDRLARLLSPDEQERAARFHFERDRRRFTVARGRLRSLLAGYAGQQPEELTFTYGPAGKPALAGETSLSFNLSHAGEVALIGLCLHHRLGVDLEQVRPVLEMASIVNRFFSAQEVAVWRGLPAEEQEVAFFNGWTRKEAYIKALGDGLAQPLDGFAVSLAPGQPARLLSVTAQPDAPIRWSLAAFSPAPGYVAAIAVKTPRARLRFWEEP